MSMRVVDLTGPMQPGMWRYDETFPEFEAVAATSLDEVGYQVQRVTISTHLGTHTDAPGHLVPGAPMVDTYALESYVGWATVFRVGPCESLEPIDAARLARAGASLRRESANIAPKPPIPSPVMVASAPPASMISVRPRRIHSVASPREWALDEHALVLQ
jgi:hypothetical protein